jgi:hypothetical protein
LDTRRDLAPVTEGRYDFDENVPPPKFPITPTLQQQLDKALFRKEELENKLSQANELVKAMENHNQLMTTELNALRQRRKSQCDDENGAGNEDDRTSLDSSAVSRSDSNDTSTVCGTKSMNKKTLEMSTTSVP